MLSNLIINWWSHCVSCHHIHLQSKWRIRFLAGLIFLYIYDVDVFRCLWLRWQFFVVNRGDHSDCLDAIYDHFVRCVWCLGFICLLSRGHWFLALAIARWTLRRMVMRHHWRRVWWGRVDSFRSRLLFLNRLSFCVLSLGFLLLLLGSLWSWRLLPPLVD